MIQHNIQSLFLAEGEREILFNSAFTGLKSFKINLEPATVAILNCASFHSLYRMLPYKQKS